MKNMVKTYDKFSKLSEVIEKRLDHKTKLLDNPEFTDAKLRERLVIEVNLLEDLKQYL